LSNREGRVGEIKNDMENITKERLDNMSKWSIDDFIFYAEMFEGGFVFNVEFDPKNPEIGWALFQNKLQEKQKEFEENGNVTGFESVDELNKLVQNKWQSQNN
jgi:hypothetical protein